MEETRKTVALPDGVADHTKFQLRFWAVQRIAWIIFAFLLFACLFGLLGRGGPFSRNIVALSEGSIDFPTISRWNAPDELTVDFAPSSEDRIFTVDDDFLQNFSIQTIDPPQKATLARNGGIGYVFPSDPAWPTQIVFRLQTQRPGLRPATVGIGAETQRQSTFLFP
jgi:protein-L-isoaspartate(D-aspartate) O-methyltransferase